ncbi:MAG: enoyl-CoA hydratase [Myxococcales bacterium]|nr:enoyl-CoA hydratase [Myxococcales bacterium]MCB9519692.1 enoyl-CoA hydratase [Myxococcales bacterium]MCB9530382.1 enoyl-CoA hydratase [Myxococcales bacterium]
MSDDPGFVEYAVEGALATITFNRPTRKNAFTAAMYEQFRAALLEAEHDATIRCTLLTGVGGAFSAGNDLHDFLDNPPTGGDSAVFRLIRTLGFTEKPLVAAVDGPAVGIGATMLLHCDLVVASTRSRFAFPFVNLGLTPECGSSLLLPRVAGLQRASELLLLGEPFDVDTAVAAGFVNRIVTPEEVLSTARELATRIAERPPTAVQAAKRLIRDPIRRQLDGVLQDEGVTFVTRLGSTECGEAIEAFFARKR